MEFCFIADFGNKGEKKACRKEKEGWEKSREVVFFVEIYEIEVLGLRIFEIKESIELGKNA